MRTRRGPFFWVAAFLITVLTDVLYRRCGPGWPLVGVLVWAAVVMGTTSSALDEWWWRKHDRRGEG